MRRMVVIGMLVSGTGCALLGQGERSATASDPTGAEGPAAAPALAPPMGAPARPDALDTATAAQTAAALAPAAGADGVLLGTAVAGLGDVGAPGFWAKSPLVTAEGSGRVAVAGTGDSAAVTLIPAVGGGTELSLSTMRALGLGLTDLPEVRLFSLPGGNGAEPPG